MKGQRGHAVNDRLFMIPPPPPPPNPPLEALAREVSVSAAFNLARRPSTPTLRMRSLGWAWTLSAICLALLSCAPHDAHAWVWGPYSAEWQSRREASSQPLMYRIVLPRNGTSPTFSGNGTAATPNGTSTVPLSTAAPAPVANASSGGALDTSCGVTSPLFTLRISGADGAVFNDWWLKLSGDSVLFTSQEDKATGFGVNSGTRHLCVPQAGRLPRIAIVEARLDTGPLYFLDANLSKNYEPEYEPITCNSVSGGGSQLACSYGATHIWSGCGLQLQLGSGQDTDGTLNCSSIALNAITS